MKSRLIFSGAHLRAPLTAPHGEQRSRRPDESRGGRRTGPSAVRRRAGRCERTPASRPHRRSYVCSYRSLLTVLPCFVGFCYFFLCISHRLHSPVSGACVSGMEGTLRSGLLRSPGHELRVELRWEIHLHPRNPGGRMEPRMEPRLAPRAQASLTGSRLPLCTVSVHAGVHRGPTRSVGPVVTPLPPRRGTAHS